MVCGWCVGSVWVVCGWCVGALVGVIAPVIPKYTITAITAFLLSRKPVIPRVIANEGEE